MDLEIHDKASIEGGDLLGIIRVGTMKHLGA